MIRHTIIIIILLLSMFGASAQRAIHIYHDGKKEADVMLNYQIDSIYFATEGKELRQVFATTKEKKSYPVSSIDSIKFQGEFLKILKPNITIPYSQTIVFGTALCSEDRDEKGHFHGYYTPDGKKGVFDIWELIKFNYSEETIVHKIPVKSESGTLCDTLYITQLQKEDGEQFLKTKGRGGAYGGYGYMTERSLFGQKEPSLIILTPDSQSVDIPVNPRLEGMLKIDPTYSSSTPSSQIDKWTPRLNDDTEDWINTVRKDNNTLTINVKENKGGYRHCFFLLESDNYRTDGGPTKVIAQLPASTHSAQEHHKALEDMYYALGGPDWNWGFEHNWLSDKPIYEWEYINNSPNLSNLFESDRVLSVIFDRSNHSYYDDNVHPVKGMLPESFTTIMDDALYMNLRNMGEIKGKVPYAITHHPKWDKFGWSFIAQDHYMGADLDFEDINLQLPDSLVWDLMTGKRVSTSDILKKNKLTLVLNVGSINDNNIDQNFDKTMNKYLDYATKGLGLVLNPGNIPESFNEERDIPKYQKLIANFRKFGLTENGIDWTYTFSNVTTHQKGDMALLDNEGNLLWFGYRNYEGMDPNHFPFSYYTNAIDAVCRKYLGEPVEHPLFSLDSYTSTDFSQDGEVIQLQKATVGKGIDIVLLGNSYVDTDMESVYLEEMNYAMEHLFKHDDIMRKLRNRFNVYTVKVVSLHNETSNDFVSPILNEEKAWEYVCKIPGFDIEKAHKAHTCIIYKGTNSALVGYGETWHNEEGGSVAVVYEGPDFVVAHEVIGHGVGRLLDEYLLCDETSAPHLTEDEIEELRNWLKEHHDKGEYLNISAYEEPEKSPWAWMFEDPEYASEVGMYQGAYIYPYDLWRPSETGMMYNDHFRGLTFNAPSREAIYYHVMKASEGEGWVYDREAFKAFDKAPVPISRSAAAPAVKDFSSDKIYIHKVPKNMKKNAKGRYIAKPSDNGFIKPVPASHAAEVNSVEAKPMGITIYVTPDGKRHTITTPRK